MKIAARPLRHVKRAAVLLVTDPRLLAHKMRYVLARGLSRARSGLPTGLASRAYFATQQAIIGAQMGPPAAKLYADAVALHARAKQALMPAIEQLSAAFALEPAPHVALKLSELQRLANRHEDALETLSRAFRANPENREIWYHTIIYHMRHGSPGATIAAAGRHPAKRPPT